VACQEAIALRIESGEYEHEFQATR
jgi:hypothetical protein